MTDHHPQTGELINKKHHRNQTGNRLVSPSNPLRLQHAQLYYSIWHSPISWTSSGSMFSELLHLQLVILIAKVT